MTHVMHDIRQRQTDFSRLGGRSCNGTSGPSGFGGFVRSGGAANDKHRSQSPHIGGPTPGTSLPATARKGPNGGVVVEITPRVEISRHGRHKTRVRNSKKRPRSRFSIPRGEGRWSRCMLAATHLGLPRPACTRGDGHGRRGDSRFDSGPPLGSFSGARRTANAGWHGRQWAAVASCPFTDYEKALTAMPSRNARGRMLHWTISHSRRVSEINGAWPKLLYTWMIPSADNLGRMEGSPAVVAGMIFPREPYATTKRIAVWLAELHEAGLICWYESRGDRFVYIKQHEDHQILKGNMADSSDFPAPPDECAVCIAAYEHVGTRHPEEKGREGKRREGNTCVGFDEFWRHYPKRRAKIDAQKAWKQTEKKRPPLAELLAKVDELSVSRDWLKDNGDWVPYPATWLRAGGWDDEVRAKR